MRFRAKLHGHDIAGEVINPGDWFGKTWIIEVGVGNGNYFLAVEADTQTDAIDVLADSDQFGHAINIDVEDVDEDTSTAGNDGHPVDLTNVAIHRDTIEDLVYVLADGKRIAPHDYNHDEMHDHQWGPVELARFTGNPHRKCQVAGCKAITLDLSDD